MTKTNVYENPTNTLCTVRRFLRKAHSSNELPFVTLDIEGFDFYYDDEKEVIIDNIRSVGDTSPMEHLEKYTMSELDNTALLTYSELENYIKHYWKHDDVTSAALELITRLRTREQGKQ